MYFMLITIVNLKGGVAKTTTDVCYLNRPFDDLEQERICLEAEAILGILQQCQDDKWSLVTSNALEFELEKNPDREKAEQVASLLAQAQARIDSCS